jgi:hypothetical protein
MRDRESTPTAGDFVELRTRLRLAESVTGGDGPVRTQLALAEPPKADGLLYAQLAGRQLNWSPETADTSTKPCAAAVS